MREGSHARAKEQRLCALAIVPARLASTRLAQKMLLRASGRYLFEHTVRGVQRARLLERVVLATDAPEILAAAREVDVPAILTSTAHGSGTERVHEAFELLSARGERAYDVVLNVQGDEPEIAGETLDPLVEAFADASVNMATLCTPLDDPEAALDPAVVKVVLDRHGDALYFSRAPIPGSGPAARASDGHLRHVGVYAFRPEALRRFCALPRGRLEAREGLEQLRWLEAGLRTRVIVAAVGSHGIDTPEQYARFLERERARSGDPHARSHA